MADITLKYLTELVAATSVKDGDLLHVNQDGNDRSLTAGVLRSFLTNSIHPIGVVMFFASNQNPNNLFSGTNWQRVPGYGRSIRLAGENGSDVLQTGGSDSVTISADNIPAHTHPVKIKTSAFDHGTKTTSTNGQHNHNIPGYITTQDSNENAIAGGRVGVWTNNKQTSDNGSHNHSLKIGSHEHTVEGYTEESGYNNSPISTKNQYINLIAWYRVS